MTRILIVEDSQVYQEYLRHIFESAGDFVVVGIAEDGRRAIELTHKTKPDVIAMDIHMPRLNGLEATRIIMQTVPTPIVIISASWNPEEVQLTFQAMEAGALAVLEKPVGPGHSDAQYMVREVIQTVRAMSEVPVVRRWGKQRNRSADTVKDDTDRTVSHVENIAVIGIGASTGGPPVLATILSGLPKDYPIPILVVQHIAEGFLKGLVKWLQDASSITICMATHGEMLEPGRVYLAPDRVHLGVTHSGRHIALNDSPPENGVRPAICYLFRSLANAYGEKACGVLLTGMGQDGAQGLYVMQQQGALTIAQDKTSSVIHGMPGEAIRLGAATHVLPPEAILAQLKRLAPKRTALIAQ